MACHTFCRLQSSPSEVTKRGDPLGLGEYLSKGSLYDCCKHLLEHFELADVFATLEAIRSSAKGFSVSPQQLSPRYTPPTFTHKPDGLELEEVASSGCVLKSGRYRGSEVPPKATAMVTPRSSDVQPTASRIDKLQSMEEIDIGIWHLLLVHFVDTFSAPSMSLARGQNHKSIAFTHIREARRCGANAASKLYRLAQMYGEYVQEGNLIALQSVPHLNSQLKEVRRKGDPRNQIPALVKSHRKHLPKARKHIEQGNFEVAKALLHRYLHLKYEKDDIAERRTVLTRLLCKWIDIDMFLEHGDIRPSRNLVETDSGEQHNSDNGERPELTIRGRKRRRLSQGSYFVVPDEHASVVNASSGLSASAADIAGSELQRGPDDLIETSGEMPAPPTYQSREACNMHDIWSVPNHSPAIQSNTIARPEQPIDATCRSIIASRCAQRSQAIPASGVWHNGYQVVSDTAVAPTALMLQQKQAAPFPYASCGSESFPRLGTAMYRFDYSLSPRQVLLYQVGATLDQAFEGLHVSEQGFFVLENGAPFRNAPCDEFDSYCFTATKFWDKGMTKHYYSALRKASSLLPHILQAKHPRTLPCFFEVFIHLCQTGLAGVAKRFCAYIQQVPAPASDAGQSLIQACRCLGQLDPVSFENDMKSAWEYIADEFDRKLTEAHPVAISVRLDYVKRVHGVSDPAKEEHLLRQLASRLGKVPKYATPRVRHNLAHNLIRQGRYHDARGVAACTKELLHNPFYSERNAEHIEFWKIMAHSYRGERAVRKAAKCLQKAIKMTQLHLGPQHAWIAEFNVVLRDWLADCGPGSQAGDV